MKKFETFILCASLISLYGCAGLNEKESLEDLQGKVTALDSSLERANAKIEDINNKMLLLNEKIEALKQSGGAPVGSASPLPPEGLKTVSLGQEGGNAGEPVKKADAYRPVSTNPVNESPEQLYKRAYELFNGGRYAESRAAFSEFIRLYPAHGLSNNARYWIGESYYSEGAFDKAIALFEEVAVKYPGDNKAPDCLLKAGLSYVEMSDKGKAREIIERLLRQYPGTDAAEKAKKTLDRISTR